ncbi:FadR/GntR family transcriptional regulator [Bosea sp. (in: a-proteobacteria)]|jgi:DNA-binding FadR family transcriptional regulator|uniref:FadR/GntR family transcriptional regulator n=1 Tax=Bosea sp. (in: a-proteobacteria) TaxID=1871050 RepID=UPI002DDDBD31|nr:FCD domain-containing protein [Bosea sp. (in: a-proteobacteria)]HEV2512142.1 FCD domain-containing protein [Bosea sp. (in: a-proteobacteria)]
MLIEPVIVPKASDMLAHQLRERILAGEFHEGSVLPNERDLASHSGLSRTSVREALRILEVQGIIAVKTGRNGGSVVQRPNREALERSLTLYIRGHRVRMESLLQTREAIEPSAAALAAQYRSEEELAQLELLHRQLEASYDDIATFRTVNIEWHLAVITASHNELLLAFYNAISDNIHEASSLKDFHSVDVRSGVIEIHRRINEAIRKQDAPAAFRRMQRHTAAFAERAMDWLATHSEQETAEETTRAAKRITTTRGRPARE